MRFNIKVAAAALALVAGAGIAPEGRPGHAFASIFNGVVTVESNYTVDETIARIKKDVASKGIMFFDLIDQSALGAAAGVKGVRPSKLLLFGNPALGTKFISANQEAGLDWPVRVLVFQKSNGKVYVSYNDFGYIARRHGIRSRNAEFKMATEVIRSVTSAAVN